MFAVPLEYEVWYLNMVTTGKWRRKYGSLKGRDPRIVIYGYDETEKIVKELKDIGVNLSLFVKDAVRIHYNYCTDNPGMMDIYMPDAEEEIKEEEDIEQTKLF